MLGGWGGNRGPGGKHWKPTAGFIASVTCGLTAEDGDWLWNPTLVAGMGLYLYVYSTSQQVLACWVARESTPKMAA